MWIEWKHYVKIIRVITATFTQFNIKYWMNNWPYCQIVGNLLVTIAKVIKTVINYWNKLMMWLFPQGNDNNIVFAL